MAQSEESQMAMFGCIIEDEKAYIMDTPTYRGFGYSMPLTSLLSDAQHYLVRGDSESSRKIMNAVKYLLNDKEFMSHQGE